MPKMKSESDPTRLFGEETPPDPNPRRGWGQPKGHTTRKDVTTGDKDQKNLRPEDVSGRVWEMAEQWMAQGEARFGKRPPLKKKDFARRLDAKINSDPTLRKWLGVPAESWRGHGEWDSGIEFVNDVLARMLAMFWNNLTEDQENTALLQFDFLDKEWDEWIYHAITSVQVKWNMAHSTWVQYDLPKAVFDPRTVGMPEDDAPCTDPLFEGMTWGQVRAAAGSDSALLATRTDTKDDAPQALGHSAPARLATWKRDTISNRETTATKETTDEP